MISHVDRMWYGMRARCKEGGIQQEKRNTYVGCVNGFGSKKEFVSWAQLQPGFGMFDGNGRRYQLDKDLLFPGNKIYSAERCSIIPSFINALMLDCGSKTETGAAWHRVTGMWQARVQTLEGRVYLGIYDTAQDAHSAWRKAKARAISDAVSRYLTMAGADIRVVRSLINESARLSEAK